MVIRVKVQYYDMSSYFVELNYNKYVWCCRFYKRHGGDELETMTKLKYYFAHIVNGVSWSLSNVLLFDSEFCFIL